MRPGFPRARNERNGHPRLPLDGIRVVEFTHMVMGPTCGMILGDLGAEVIKVEPPGGDKTRKLIGSGAGFFSLFNRNKKSVTADLSNAKDRARIEKLIAGADIVSENFRAGALTKHGLDYASLKKKHKRLIYVSHKGFLPGPYDHRVALDEVVQMMAGLAYMTGPPGRPLRAGSSVNDIMGGMFGAIGALAAIAEREHTGTRPGSAGRAVRELRALVGAAHAAIPPRPASPRRRCRTASMRGACSTCSRPPTASRCFSASSPTPNGRCSAAPSISARWRAIRASPATTCASRRATGCCPALRKIVRRYSAKDLQAVFEREGLPYAPIVKPEQLFDDPHLLASGGLADLTLENGETDAGAAAAAVAGRAAFDAAHAAGTVGGA